MTVIQQEGVCLRDAMRVGQFIIEELLECFSYLLKVNSLARYIPMFNANQLHTLNQQCVAYFYLQGESNSSIKKITQDSMPKTIAKDAMATSFNHSLLKQDSYHLTTTSVCNNQSLILPIQIESPYSLSYSLSKGEGSRMVSNGTYNKVGDFKVTSQMIKNNNTSKSNIFNQRPQQSSLNSHSIPLTFPRQQQQQPNPIQQRQLQHVKKSLYTMRRYRRISIEQQRQSIDKLNKKKSHLLLVSKAEHTYDYDGSVIEKRKVNVGANCEKSVLAFRDDNNKSNNSSSIFGNVTELHTNIGGFNNKHALKRGKHSLNSNTKKLKELNTSSLFDQLPINNSQDKQRKIQFNNCNKRQVSHLPFISLRDNSKIIQNNSKQLSGCVTQRSSLNMKKMSQLQSNKGINESNRKFRFFSQIELEKKRMQISKQKVLDEQSRELIQLGILPQTLLNNKSSNNNPQQQQFYQKRSKMMQKYLKKLTQQKSKIEKQITQDSNNLKSLNFNQLTVPQKYPIQRYYQYDFEGEIKAYEYSISSKLSTKRNSLSLANETEPN